MAEQHHPTGFYISIINNKAACHMNHMIKGGIIESNSKKQ